ncbi:ABC transporter ATP-binding protein [Brevibacterium sp. GP-SGM9]|uniref:ABC transporter ATP-binding protein n=1 Tax=Brevibacterium sp. GP-SGM9 TaxID=3376990 RepID=UPI0039A5E6C0
MIRTLFALLPADRHRKAFLHVGLTLLSVILRALGAVLLVPLIAALFGPDPARAWPWVGLLALVTAAGWAIDAVISRIGIDLGFALLDNAQHGVADRLARIRLSWFTAANTATAREAIASGGPDLVGIIVYLLTPLLAGITLPVAIALALLPISVPLGIAALIGVPILLAAFFGGARIGRRADRAAAESNTELTERVVEFARTQQALRAARRSAPARSLVGSALARQHGATMKLMLLQIPGQLLFGLASQLALLILAGTTAYLTVSGRLGVAEAIALIVVIIRYLEPFTSLAELAPAIETTTGVLRTIRAVLEAPTTSGGTTSAEFAAPPRIEFQQVSFRYGHADGGQNAAEVLHELDISFEPGTTTAIVGPSGSGKSTILSLVAGLQEPSSGRVLIDGQDPRDWDAETRRRAASVVFQHPYLFEGSIRENILAGAMGSPGTTGATDSTTDAAHHLDTVARLARVDELTTRLSGGWEAEVGEGGTALSGGERQRVSIARAILKPAPILLVDEATSALDTENETAIVTALTEDATPRTRILVAHRLESIRTADRVIFLADGGVVEDGSIEQLLAANGRFAHFWSEQDAAADWKLGAPNPD